MKTLLIERQTPGEQFGASSCIENYLGFPTDLIASELAHRTWTQVTRLGAESMAPQEVVNLHVQNSYKVLTLRDQSIIRTKAVVLTTGVSYRTLDASGLERLSGARRVEARSCSNCLV
ncbi:NAD(P)/FAD-dependent oxidoreductase [Hymenobacter volaticus]|uniref:FAD/NAD(P)-binding domain-containing protein n=1 Tax=Hymenobacter volaticus TaxID=2932254 RepID=A0ABY4GCY7_9BACT|nr:hypothetical protein [Hymenobacter volaticus]UOQ68757.1 hypothetical protein MUN86_25065 [Hymenobacter volaticus]